MQERDVRVYGGDQPHSETFANTRDAAGYLARRLSSGWHISSLIGRTLEVELVDIDGRGVDGQEIINLKANDKEVISTPRHTSSNPEGVTLQTGDMNLIAQVGPYHKNPIMDRGLLWVNAAGNRESEMSFGLKAGHGLSEQELEEHIDTVLERGEAFVSGLLDGQPNPPYSKDFPATVAA